MRLTDEEKTLIESQGYSVSEVENQIQSIVSFEYIELIRSATINDGILKLNEAEADNFLKKVTTKKLDLLHFIPASGLASRMFSDIVKFCAEFDYKQETYRTYLNRTNHDKVNSFFIGLKLLPFYKKLFKFIQTKYTNFELKPDSEQRFLIAKALIDNKALDYLSIPKGLIDFHTYGGEPITAFEEHIYEAVFMKESLAFVDLHFTILESHKAKFEEKAKQVATKLNTKLNISFSFQNEQKKTICLDVPKKHLIKENKDKILFRHSGHGVLLENLNKVDNAYVFLKNIDNVFLNFNFDAITKYKKILTSVLIEKQALMFDLLKKLNKTYTLPEELITLIKSLNIILPDNFELFSERNKRLYLKEKLNRPIRVCGMVLNEGNEGGGPFWIKGKESVESLQIIEFVQINGKNKIQKQKFKKSTHFNPVFMVCGMKSYTGQKFDLEKYVDKTKFIATKKTYKNTPIYGLEYPGLWNGSMSGWITILVEVPLIVFNPVKTLTNLLSKFH